MHVKKRNNKTEIVSFDKILKRIKTLGLEHGISINYTSLAIKVIDQLYDGIDTSRIDELTAEQSASMATIHPDYGTLASALVISNLHKKTDASFHKSMNKIYNFKDVNNIHVPLLSQEFIYIINEFGAYFDNIIDYNRDYLIDYFGVKTLERAYLIHINGHIIERPQHMWLRVAICIHKDDLDAITETYNLMSQKYFTHATPTLFNAGTPRPQLSSCFLIAMENDSVDGIYNTLKECANISKWAGGIGLHIHNIRAKGSHIRGTNGTSNGIVPMLSVFNKTARYIDQCITPETYIYTTRGPIEIQYITNNDYIFNSTGNVEQIENVLEHPYDGEIYSIETTHSIEPLQVTDQHPIFVLVNQVRGTDFSTIEKRLKHYEMDDSTNQIIQWKDVKDLTMDDMLIYTIPQYVSDIHTITQEDCYMYGVILGDGCFDNKSTTGYISLHTINKGYILDYCKNYFEKKCINYSVNTIDNIARIRWNKNIIMPFRYADIYDMGHEKHIASRWLNLPIEKAKYIIKGLIDTGGCKDKELLFDSTSRNLIESVRYLLLRMGIPTSGDRRCMIENKKVCYTLSVPQTDEICQLVNIENNSKFFKFLKYKNYIFTRIKSISKIEYTGTLYDLQMKNKHEYMIHNGIIHNGGGRRNGSFAIYIEPHHPDIEDFLDLKKNHGDEELRARDLFYALWISDLFMERVKTNSEWSLFCPDSAPGLSECYGDEYKNLYAKYESEKRFIRQINARDLWIKILDSQMETGTPYMLYKDSVNKKSNQQNLGTIKSSNLCVAPETCILTDKGQFEIHSLKDKKVNVWNGKEFSEVEIKQTNDCSELMTITFSDGAELTCTKYHKFYIQDGFIKGKLKSDIINSSKVTVIEAQNLCENMKLIKCEYPIIDYKNDKDDKEINLEYAYTNGFFSGDGTYCNISNIEEKSCKFKALNDKSYCKRHVNSQRNNESTEYCQANSYSKKPRVTLYGEKIKLLENLDYISTGKEKDNRLNVTLNVNLKEKYFVPINYSLKSKLDWLSGYCDADGTISKNGDNQSLQISSIHKDFLLKIKLMLQTCGVSSKVTLNMAKRLSYLPNGKNGYDYFESKPIWRLLVPSNDLMKLLELGLSCKRLVINKKIYQRNATQFVTVIKTENHGRLDKTFCFNESKRHAGIFNGVITSNCTEITEYSNENETAVCNLASIALNKFVVETPNPFTNVIIYSKESCNWCVLLKALLKRKSIEYHEITLVTDEQIADFKDKWKVETVPQLIDNGILVGGFTECLEILRKKFDYRELHKVTKVVANNLNKVIDINFYPTEKTKRSNLYHRPVGIGVQGFADTFILMDIPFHSDAAKVINKNIFETIYHAALEQSMELSKERNKDMNILNNTYMSSWSFKDINDDLCQEYVVDDYLNSSSSSTAKTELNINVLLKKHKPIRREIEREKSHCYGSYSSFEGSPASTGILQFDMWNVNPTANSNINYDWTNLKTMIKTHGLRNCLSVAPMPTASTSQILGNNECFEPFTSNIYSRRTLAGEFVLANKYLIKELIELGIWNTDIKNNIIMNKGSVQYIDTIPKFIKDKYKIVWEIPMKHLIDMAKDRGAFICQSQSLNLWMEDPDAKSLTNMHFYGWNSGLKTGIYYLRRKAKHQPQQFTIEPTKNPDAISELSSEMTSGCDMCSG